MNLKSAFPLSDNAVTEGLNKRELFALQMACGMLHEYVRKPTPPVIEMINSSAIRMADDLLQQLKKSEEDYLATIDLGE